MQKDLEIFLQEGNSEGFVDIATCRKAAEKFGFSYSEIEKTALHVNLMPLRYKRNQSSISFEEQKVLLNSHVAIIGCGGLGGHVAENLARIGVGRLSLFDFDVFEEHNLNRQNFSCFTNIGKEKVTVVKEACENINPALHVEAFCKEFDAKKDFTLVQDADVIIDALDNPQTKLDLSFTCKEQNKAFVHGAIAGFSSQHSTCNTLENFYKDGSKGAEKEVGNPSFTVSYAASLQSAECIKLLLNKGEVFKESFFMSDILNNEFIFL